MRKSIIAGNWKMNKTRAEAEALINQIKPLVKGASSDIVICVPFTDLEIAARLTAGSNIALGAQNIAWAASGAFTGEISGAMLTDLGVKYVIIGHSERRQYFGETDATVNARVKAALANGLCPIVCVGETGKQREDGKTLRVVKKQISAAFEGIDAKGLGTCVIAYEPVWAIGTGKTATAADAQEVIKFIRSVIYKLYGEAAAQLLPIQYGGSMNGGNADELMAMPDIDGGLIGGASLKPEEFAKICNVKKTKF